MKIKFLLILMICFTVGPLTGTDKKTLDPKLAALVEKIDAKTATIQTIKARFKQRKEISLFKEPLEMEGDFYFKRQDGFKFESDPEDDLIIVITDEETISISPKAKKAGRIKMKKRHGRLVEKLLSEKIKTLTNNFEIHNEEMAEEEGYHLTLTPAKRRIKKRFQDIHIWINPDHLIHKIKVTMKDGDVYELSLNAIRLNEEIPSDAFIVTIPEDFEMGERMEYILGAGMTL